MYSFCEIYLLLFFLSLFELQWTIWLAQWGCLLLLRWAIVHMYMHLKKHTQWCFSKSHTIMLMCSQSPGCKPLGCQPPTNNHVVRPEYTHKTFYLVVTLDPSLTYMNHIVKTKAKLEPRTTSSRSCLTTVTNRVTDAGTIRNTALLKKKLKTCSCLVLLPHIRGEFLSHKDKLKEKNDALQLYTPPERTDR